MKRLSNIRLGLTAVLMLLGLLCVPVYLFDIRFMGLDRVLGYGVMALTISALLILITEKCVSAAVSFKESRKQSTHVGVPEWKMSVETCVKLLHAILRVWPRVAPIYKDPEMEPFKAFITKEFSPRDFVNPVRSVSKILNTIDSGGETILIDFLDQNKLLNRATFRIENNDWKLNGLLFQCPVCFGTGNNDGERCTICGGTGWA